MLTALFLVAIVCGLVQELRVPVLRMAYKGKKSRKRSALVTVAEEVK